MLNFKNLKIVQKANTRESSPKGQNWDFRFRLSEKKDGTVDHLFFMSNKEWDRLNLDNMGLIQFEDEGKVGFLVVDNDKAVILKKTSKGEKGRKFKAELLMNALVENGQLNPELINQNQCYNLLDISDDLRDAPDYIHGAYLIEVDMEASDSPEELEEEEEEEEEETLED